VPTAPRPYTVAEVGAEPLLLNTRLGTYTNFVNLLDLAALAVPAGFRSDGVPWGVTLIAPAWRETELLALGARCHERAGGQLGATGVPLASTPPIPEPVKTGTVRLAVVGAHLSGLPLNHQLTDRGARLVGPAQTAPAYRLYSLPDTIPPKPGLVRATQGGDTVAVEVWELSVAAFGSFVAAVPPPLCIGTITLAGGETVKGFLCEAHAVERARDITSFGGWRAFLQGGAAK
jgi:allophanate hydrolase